MKRTYFWWGYSFKYHLSSSLAFTQWQTIMLPNRILYALVMKADRTEFIIKMNDKMFVTFFISKFKKKKNLGGGGERYRFTLHYLTLSRDLAFLLKYILSKRYNRSKENSQIKDFFLKCPIYFILNLHAANRYQKSRGKKQPPRILF